MSKESRNLGGLRERSRTASFPRRTKKGNGEQLLRHSKGLKQTDPAKFALYYVPRELDPSGVLDTAGYGFAGPKPFFEHLAIPSDIMCISETRVPFQFETAHTVSKCPSPSSTYKYPASLVSTFNTSLPTIQPFASIFNSSLTKISYRHFDGSGVAEAALPASGIDTSIPRLPYDSPAGEAHSQEQSGVGVPG
ncbi:hypothetical protein K440DRAFT_638214 [Wilcoxina mikolae CBS 423.85]|nr:hypothetical protein K440DRAFT_638214 [Wilcoxina mikolae CBS 423.85]